MKKGIIVGAGIGGLTTAIALLKKGFDITVYEQASELSEVGAGIWIAPNGLKVYERLGISQEIITTGKELSQIKVIDCNNKVLSKIDNAKIKQKHNYATIATHRATLHKILLSHILANRIITGKRFLSYNQDKDTVGVRFEDGSRIEANFLINADGIKSRARQQMAPSTTLRYSGQTCWRFITDYQIGKEQKNDMYEIWGNAKGLRAAYSQINEKEVYCYITAFAEAGRKDNQETLKSDLLKLCKPFQPIISDLIQAVEITKIIRSDLFDFAPIKKWTDGKVALLGDAAHATTPNLGQGACQAIEDAYVIADCLANEEDPEKAFLKYQNIRIKKAEFITNTSWQVAQATNTSGFSKFMIKQILALTPAFINAKQINKIYDINF